MIKIKNLRKNKVGATTVEMALVFPIFLLFVFGLVEFYRAYWIINSMQLALDNTGRFVMLNEATSDATIISTVKTNLLAQNSGNFTVTSTSQASGGVNYKYITVSYNFVFIPAGILPFGTINLTRSSTVPLM